MGFIHRGVLFIMSDDEIEKSSAPRFDDGPAPTGDRFRSNSAAIHSAPK